MLRLFAFLVLMACSFSGLAQGVACNKTVYLSFDTGNMSVAQLVSDVLNRQHVKATFFLANEKTSRGDFALDDSWKSFWQDRLREGHHFGSHTYDHVYFLKDASNKEVFERPQFGPKTGETILYNEASFCREIRRVDDRFKELTSPCLPNLSIAESGAP